MEPLLKQLKELPKRLAVLSAAARIGLIGGLLGVGAVVLGLSMLSDSGRYEYAFTNLTTEDSTEAGAVLKSANIAFKYEANGSALAVPAEKIHEARLLLAAAGLPRGGGIGFEIFDRGDLGVSEFTQKVNLRRAIEGELARTIGHLTPVRSARVHITMPEKGLYRNEDRKATAAVVLNLQPGRTVEEKELAGIRHLVSAAVAGLSADSVSVMDGRGTVLSGDRSPGARIASEQREMEASLEQRIIDLLEPITGRGAVVAKVTATVDTREMESTSDAFDPDTTAVRSERKTTELITSDASNGAGVAGAAANQPLNPAPAGGGGGNKSQTSREDSLKNYEVSKTTTRTTTRGARLTRLSAAVLVSGSGGKPRPDAEMRRLGELAKHAVGFDLERGDRFDISSAPFLDIEAEAAAEAAKAGGVWARPEVKYGAPGLLALLIIAGAVFFAMRGKRKVQSAELALLKPGAKVGDLEAVLRANAGELPAGARDVAGLPPSQAATTQIRARELTELDPQRAAHLLRAWISSDSESKESARA
jgi:flagellar M-ring protein FliF